MTVTVTRRPLGQSIEDLVGRVRGHRPAGQPDVCGWCGWRWPCPALFHARRSLIARGVPPQVWA